MDKNIIMTLARHIFADKYTHGKLYMFKEFFGYILEDKVRDANHDGDLKDAGEEKIHGKTAIPCGVYEVILTYSNRFKKLMPLFVAVPGFDGVRMHGGNKVEDTEGCPLLGADTDNKGYVGRCKEINDRLISILKKETAKGKVYIEVIDKAA